MCLETLIGYRQPFDTNCIPEIDSALTVSISGLYANDFHPLCTPENIYYLLPEYDEAVTPTMTLSDKLEQLRNQAISKVKNYITQSKKLQGFKQTLIDNKPVFVGNVAAMEQNKTGSFCGIRIRLYDELGLSMILNRLGIFLTQNQDLDIYIFNQSQQDPIAVIPISYTKAGSYQWFDIEQELLFDSHDYQAGSEFYIGYFENDLVGNAVYNHIFDWAMPCRSCGSYPHNREFYKVRSRYNYMMPFKVSAGGLNGTQLFDFESIQEYRNNSQGLNLSFSIICNPDLVYCENKNQFTNSLGWQLAYDILNELAHSSRVSGLRNGVSEMAKEALMNASPEGVTSNLEKAKEAISFDFSSLDSVCFPCTRNKVSIKNI